MIKKTFLFLIFIALGAFIPQIIFNYRSVLMELIMPIHIFVILITYACGRKAGFFSIPLLLSYNFLLYDILGYPEVMFMLAELLLYVYFISIFVHVTKHEFMNLIISMYIAKFSVLILFFITYSIITAREIINVYEYADQLLWGFTHVPIVALIVWVMKKLNLVSLNESKMVNEW